VTTFVHSVKIILVSLRSSAFSWQSSCSRKFEGVRANRRKYDDLVTGPSDLNAQPRHLWSCTTDSAPSEARKQGSGGGSPRKYDDLVTGPSTWMLSQSTYGAVPPTTRRAKRENGGLGKDPPGSTMTYSQVLRTWMLSQGTRAIV
jgi:hypothetical protein